MMLDHLGLACADIDRAVAFYRDVLGLEVRGRGESRSPSAGRFAWADLNLPDGRILELISYLEQAPPGPHIGLAVDDIDATLVRLAAAGVTPVRPPRTIAEPGDWDGVRLAHVQDPDGHTLELLQRP